MAKVRARKETNNLYLDFSYLGYRCREQTALPDTPQNRKKVEAVLKRVEAQIILDQFDYEKEFPGSKNLKRIKERELQNKVNDLPFNCFSNEVHQTFSEFAETWFLESEVQWRSSHTKNVRGIIDSSLKPAFGSKPIDQISKAEILQFRAMLARKPGRNCNGLKSQLSLLWMASLLVSVHRCCCIVILSTAMPLLFSNCPLPDWALHRRVAPVCCCPRALATEQPSRF